MSLSEIGWFVETGVVGMPEFVLRVGSRTAQGVRSNNEDNLVVDIRQQLFIVADGMGGQERGEVASSMAVDIIPRVIHSRLEQNERPERALLEAMLITNQAIVDSGRSQPEGRRMGTTVVVALVHDGQVYTTHLGDSRAYLIRGHDVQQLTVDHSVAQALVTTGALTAEEARFSPYQHVLHKFLGCSELNGATEVRPLTPQIGDRILLATDGMTNHISEEELRTGSKLHPDSQEWVDHLVQTALDHGSRDNVTGIVIAFEAAPTPA